MIKEKEQRFHSDSTKRKINLTNIAKRTERNTFRNKKRSSNKCCP